MSEKTTSAEIEDVLSSIRRLVSDELRMPEGQARPAVPEKLVLTPAQRVDHPSAPEQGPVSLLAKGGSAPRGGDRNGADAPDGQGPENEPENEPVIGLAGRFAALRAVVADRRLASEGERTAALREGQGPEGAPPEVPEAAIWIEGEDDDWVEDWAEPETADFISFPSPAAPEGAEVVLLRQPVRREAVPDAAPATGPDAAPDAGSGKDSLTKDSPAGNSLAGAAGDRPGVLVLEHPVAVKAPPADLGHELYPESEPTPAGIHAGMDEGMDAGTDAGIEAEIAARIEAELAAELAASVAARPPEAAARDVSPDPGTDRAEGAFAGFDEDQLRILVRGMIKSELQGELGERITRNIRKMLRAEITRALSAHGLS